MSEQSAELVRYGLEWRGQTEFVCHPMPDGYWTPWHLAQAEIERLRHERDEALAEGAEKRLPLSVCASCGHTWTEDTVWCARCAERI